VVVVVTVVEVEVEVEDVEVVVLLVVVVAGKQTPDRHEPPFEHEEPSTTGRPGKHCCVKQTPS
jgi:hypothetical protein